MNSVRVCARVCRPARKVCHVRPRLAAAPGGHLAGFLAKDVQPALPHAAQVRASARAAPAALTPVRLPPRSLRQIILHVDAIQDLRGVPPQVVEMLFAAVISARRLTVPLARVFAASDSEQVARCVPAPSPPADPTALAPHAPRCSIVSELDLFAAMPDASSLAKGAHGAPRPLPARSRSPPPLARPGCRPE